MHKVRTFGVLVALGASACSPQPNEVAETWRSGRDGLCVAGTEGALRGGLVAYGKGDVNCSLAGAVTRDGDRLTIIARGDSHCRVDVTTGGGRARLGPLTEACAYYCGPGADFSGRTLQPSSDAPGRITDLVGDPLC